MGVTNSKRVYDEEPDEDGKKGKGDKGADASGTGAADSGAAGADASGNETPAPEAEKDVDKIKAENLRIWSPYYKDFFAFPEARKKLQNVIKNLPADKYSEKKIKVTEKDFDAYLSDSGPLSEYFKEDLDKSFLSDENTYKSMIGTSIPGDNGTKKLMDLTHIKEDKAKSEQFTKLIPVWIEEMFLPDVKKAVVNDALAKVMKDLIETKEFKAYQKENIIGDKKEDILSGKTSKEEAAIEVKEGNPNAPAAAEPAAAEPAAAAEEKKGGAEQVGGEGINDMPVEAVQVEAVPVEEGGCNNKKDYKEFKKEQRGDFTEKQTAFFSDTVKLKKFLLENEDSLLDMVNNKKSDKKTDMIAKTFEAINNYVKEPDTEGFAANPPPPPPGAEGEAAGKDSAAAGKDGAADGAAAGKDSAADGAAEGKDGEKKDAKPEEKPAAPPDAKPEAKGGATMQEGGAKPSKKKKKKVNRKKKQRKINISINVGNKNSISDSECSDSETSDSSTSDSSTSSSSTSDSSSSSDSSTSSSSSDTSTSSSDTSSSSDSEYERRKKKQKQKKRVRRKRGPKNKK